jgi:hypothetical protein
VNIFRTTDASYSKDVEIDDTGKVVYLRDFAPGEVIEIPMHMLRLILARGCPTPVYRSDES